MSSVRHRVSAAILAGGRSTPLGGADQAALLIGGARTIDRQIAMLAAVADDVTIVTNDPARYPGLQIPVQPDAMPGAGALAVTDLAIDVRMRETSAEALAAHAPHDRLFVNINTPHDYARARNAVMLGPFQDRITEEQ